MDADIAELYHGRARGINLLRSGSDISDVVIICGDREWKCHRAILVTHSIWFRKALTGPFEEATTGRVTLNEQDPIAVDLALTHIYGLGFNVASEIPDRHHVVQSVSLWRTADFLQLPVLKSLVEKAVGNYCDKQMKQLCTKESEFKWSRNDADNELSPWALDLVAGTLDAYKWHISSLKDVLMEFIWVGKEWTLVPGVSTTILGHFKDTPKFVEDLISRYATGLWLQNPRWAAFGEAEIQDYWNTKVHSCAQCGKQTTGECKGQVKNPFKLEGQNNYDVGWCRRCSHLKMVPWREGPVRDEEVEGMLDLVKDEYFEEF